MRAALAVALAALAAAAASTATASPSLRLGLVDHAGAYYDDPRVFWPLLAETGARTLRVDLNWGGRLGVATRRPGRPRDPADPAYDWRLYDAIVQRAAARYVDIVFSIFRTPRWANGGRTPAYAPTDAAALRDFATAAATRYSGFYPRGDGVVLPAVRYWIAWNEPNLRLGLVPQWRRAGRRWVHASPAAYARICNAVVQGVHTTLLARRQVACGATAARGNDNPRAAKPSISPLAFLRSMRRAGARGFDAYAHHGYYGSPRETPSTRPRNGRSITLANVDVLVRAVDRLYGRKRIWITEYGYQTNPPDRLYGVSWARQARYVRQAYALARRHPRVDMLLWFLLRDEPRLEGWQSGLLTVRGVRKPAFAAFRSVAGGGLRARASAPASRALPLCVLARIAAASPNAVSSLAPTACPPAP